MGSSEHREVQTQSQPNLPVRVSKEVDLKEHIQNKSNCKTDHLEGIFQKVRICDDEKRNKEMKNHLKKPQIRVKKVKEVERKDKENEFDGELIETSLTLNVREVEKKSNKKNEGNEMDMLGEYKTMPLIFNGNGIEARGKKWKVSRIL